jgi:VanZ family protein
MKKFLYFVPAILFYLLIFILSSQDLGIRIHLHHLDKVVHMIEFAIMAGFLSFGFFNVLNTPTATKIIVTFFFGLGLGVLDEFHQHYVPGRTMDARDAAADAVGVVCGILIYLYLVKKINRAAGA